MLDILRSVITGVNASRNLEQALTFIVERVKPAMGVDVCSVYLTDVESGELVLMATDGLLQESVGFVRLQLDEGLVGLVAQRAELINLDNAPDHPRYRYFPETGEEVYHAFLGVPIIHQRKVLGVLVVQQSAGKRYDEDTVTVLATIAAQLAGAIVHAEASGGIEALLGSRGPNGYALRGLPGAPGVAIGKAVAVLPHADIESIPDRAIDDVKAEQKRFLDAVTAVRGEIHEMVENMSTVLPAADSVLFDAYLMMLDSDSLIDGVIEGIREGNWAPGALRETFREHITAFDEMDDPYLRERAEDVRDLGRRILNQLQQKPVRGARYPKNTVLIGEEITASMLAEVPPKSLAGVVSVRGSSTSHTAILARALGIPAVLGVADMRVAWVDGMELIADGYSGRVFVNATKEIKKEYRRLQQEEKELREDLKELRDLESVTTDGFRVPLYANTGLLSDIRPSIASGAEGVGLYRTEFPFMARDRFPGEEEQTLVYRQVLESFHPRPVTMRTLDVGGDKALPYFPIEEDNPFLGWRGIRITLDHPEIFLVQIRAMLMANEGMNNLKMLLPMISTLSEVDESMVLIRRAHEELLEEGHDIPMPEVGVMVEVPSLIYQIAALAKRVDFISIGSNDLTQYLLAVDRNNSRVAELYDSLHPAVVHAMYAVISEAKMHRLPVSVCGEMAGDPAAALLLLGMGINSLSMSASSLQRIKWVIRSFKKRRARTLLAKVLEMEDANEIRRYLSRALDKEGLGGLIRAGK
jgi:phosphotransferase system, enzyme I, PtsP